MTLFLEQHYLFLKAMHIIFVLAWMAGIMYLPRLFVYHKMHESNHTIYDMFLLMERRLLHMIILPSAIGTIITGGLLLSIPQASNLSTWTPYIKLLFVGFLSGFQIFFFLCWRDFCFHRNKKSARFFRATNEIPFLIAVVIVFLVVLKPF